MADSSIPVGTTGKSLQTYENNVGGADVHSEAVTPTDQNGVPFTTSNRFPVDATFSGGTVDQGAPNAGGVDAWPVTGPLTNTELRATPVPVSGTVTSTPSGTQDVNITQVAGITVRTGGVTGSQGVGGLAATGAAAVGNPVLAAGLDGAGQVRPQTLLGDVSDGVAVTTGGNGMVNARNTVFNGTSWDRQRGNTGGAFSIPTPNASSTAASIFRDVALTNTAVAIKASSGRVLSGHFFNPGSALAYLHFYNVAAASVTVGTTVPVYSIPLPSNANGSVADDWVPPHPIPFATAISMAASTTPNGGTAPSTALVVSGLYI